MTDDDDSHSDSRLVVEGRREEHATYQPAWTVLLRPIQAFIGMLPSHKDTRRGRRTAKQIRIVVGVVGLIIVVAAEATLLMLVGIFVLGLAPWFPISQSLQRTWIRALKRTREPRATTESRGVELRVDSDDLTISSGDETDDLRRLPLADEGTRATIGAVSGRLLLRVDARDADQTTWIATDELDADELPDDWQLESFDGEAVRRPTVVDGSSWRRIADRLRE